MSATEKKLDWLNDLGIANAVKKDLPEGTPVQVWGQASPEASYDQIVSIEIGGVEPDGKTFSYLALDDTHPEYAPLYLTPSSAEMDLSGVKAELLGNITDGGRIVFDAQVLKEVGLFAD